MEKLLARLPPVVGASLATAFGGTAVIATRYVIGETDAVALAFLRHLGCGLMAAAVAVGAIYATAAGPYLRRSPSLAVAAYSILLGAAALLVAVVWRGDFAHLVSFSPTGWLAVLWLAGPAGVLPFYLWVWAF